MFTKNNSVRPIRTVRKGKYRSSRDISHFWLFIPLVELFVILIALFFWVKDINIINVAAIFFVLGLIVFFLGEGYEISILIDIQFFFITFVCLILSGYLQHYYILFSIGFMIPLFLLFLLIVECGNRIDFKLHFKRKLTTLLSNCFAFFFKYLFYISIYPFYLIYKKVKLLLNRRSRIRKIKKKIKNKTERKYFIILFKALEFFYEILDGKIIEIRFNQRIIDHWLGKQREIIEIISNFEDLKKLSLKNLELTSLHFLNGLEGLNELYKLDLSNNKIEIFNLKSPFPKLRYLNLENNIITRIEIIDQCDNLIELNLKHNKLIRIENIEHLASLEDLILRNNLIKQISNIDHLGNLNILDLSCNQITKIENLNYNYKIQRLELSTNLLCEIEGLNSLSHLKELNLANNEISEIKNINHLKYLVSLNLSNNKIKEIKNIENLKNLRSLNLSKNEITELREISQLNSLTKDGLMLSDNQFDEHVKLIIKNKPIKQLLKYSFEQERSRISKITSKKTNTEEDYLNEDELHEKKSKKNPFIEALIKELENRTYRFTEVMNKEDEWNILCKVYSEVDEEFRVVKVYKKPINEFHRKSYLDNIKKLKRYRHNSIIQVFENGIFNFKKKQYFFYIREYVEGNTLEEIRPHLFWENHGYHERIMLFNETLSAIKVFRRKYDLHNDLHLGNIILTLENNIKIIDFSSSQEAYSSAKPDYDMYLIRHSLMEFFLTREEIEKIKKNNNLKVMDFNEFKHLIKNELPKEGL